ncbi:LptF/LptG family permease [Tautonia plasticadhaerens]|uniref:Putative permease YjgP/YjgQ family protein n=1 Tax=Tautonia plasticadhaerens TaxID=2527974 RepID=A0A518H3I3_9BACT|nr:LptF/LptG family permease [Tautonia plasticadhaerens]QDV35411.1 putative permease YjgP/YjgQ family protein [Tautonia plasticadhaerens]
MLRILDRQRYWAFLKAYVICFVSLVGLIIVIDAFANFDEFTQAAGGLALLKKIGRYYLVRTSLFLDRLSGVIAMMAAVFTATWMQRNNELLAMLAAGVGTKRVIRPVLISACLVNGVAVLNQEWVMPEIADELMQKPAHFDGKQVTAFHSRQDRNGVAVSVGTGGEGDPRRRIVTKFHAFLPVPALGTFGTVDAAEAAYVPPGHAGVPHSGGWLLRRARVSPPDAPVDPELLIELQAPDGLAGFPPSKDGLADLGGRTFFLRTDVSFKAITRDHREWFRYASTPDLVEALADPSNDPEKTEIAVYLHTRMLRPLMGMALLFLSLPLVLGGEGRNMFLNLGLSLATSAAYYGTLNVAQYLGGNGVLTPMIAAWGPLVAFGTIAAARWDSIRT